eukprot:5040843-Amphidinium_carterae.1
MCRGVRNPGAIPQVCWLFGMLAILASKGAQSYHIARLGCRAIPLRSVNLQSNIKYFGLGVFLGRAWKIFWN